MKRPSGKPAPSKYRYVTLTFPDGHKVRLITEDQENNPALVALARTYGIKSKLGRRLSGAEATYPQCVQGQRMASTKGANPSHPLSPDFGRGSGAPI